MSIVKPYLSMNLVVPQKSGIIEHVNCNIFRRKSQSLSGKKAYVLRKPTENFGTRTKCGAVGETYVSRTGIQHGQHRGENSPARRAVPRISSRPQTLGTSSLARSMHDLSRALVAVGVRSVLHISVHHRLQATWSARYVRRD